MLKFSYQLWICLFSSGFRIKLVIGLQIITFFQFTRQIIFSHSHYKKTLFMLLFFCEQDTFHYRKYFQKLFGIIAGLFSHSHIWHICMLIFTQLCSVYLYAYFHTVMFGTFASLFLNSHVCTFECLFLQSCLVYLHAYFQQ